METAQRLAQTWMATGTDEEVEATAAGAHHEPRIRGRYYTEMSYKGINNGDIKLLHVVQALGEYLTSEEDLLRTKGTHYALSCTLSLFS